MEGIPFYYLINLEKFRLDQRLKMLSRRMMQAISEARNGYNV